APASVAASGATDTSMVITWSAVAGAAGYHLYRGDARVNAAPLTATTATDSGLAPGTTYAWTVTALDAAGAESARSAPATGTTTGAAVACFTASNYAHTTAGRARMSGGYTLANGSNQNLGLWNVFVTTTLKRTGTNFYVIGTCS
ncbi:MAG TPA: fibronectin type III domain-containing protein, partial [Gemmatimonadales bacterium]|nr:fibronectin type III domain-containing protein [Gemmatimonadales bacterium]